MPSKLQKIMILPHAAVWAVAWPMILSNLSVPLLSIVDTAILGHLDNALHLGAVALGASIIAIFFWSMGFLRMGTTSLVAQAQGQQDHRATECLLPQSVLLAGSLGLALIALQQPLLDLAFWWLAPPDELLPAAREYSTIRIWGAPAVLISFTCIGWLIGQQNARLPLLLMVTTNLINLLLDLIFILGFGWESRGAALATVCADYLGLALAGILILQRYPTLRRFSDWAALQQLSAYRALLNINRDLFIRTLLLLFTFAFFNAQGAQMGTEVLAANSIIFQLLMLTSYGLDGFAQASEALVGTARGSKSRQAFRRTTLTTGIWSLLVALMMTSLFVLLQEPLVTLFTDLEVIERQLRLYLPWIFILPLLSVTAFWLDGIYIGAGASTLMRNAMIFSTLAVFLPCWWLFQPWQNHGLWLAFGAFNLSRGLSLLALLPHLQRQHFPLSVPSGACSKAQ